MKINYKVLLSLVILICCIGGTTNAVERSKEIYPVPFYQFREIYPTSSPEVIIDANSKRPVPSKPKIRVPDSPVIAVPIVTKATTKVRNGVASYYCLSGISRCTVGHPSGMYAAIRKDLLFLRGRTIQVCKYHTTKCIFVKIIDCNCGPHANLIDLYSDAFKKLSLLSMGVVKVTIKW